MGKTAPRKKRITWGRASQKMRHELMFEQVKLVDAQKQLRSLITKVNEQINVLKVQELQLRSMAVNADIKPIISKFEAASSSKDYDFETSAAVINSQSLDLDVMAAKFFKEYQEEEYDDEE